MHIDTRPEERRLRAVQRLTDLIAQYNKRRRAGDLERILLAYKWCWGWQRAEAVDRVLYEMRDV